MSLELVPDNPQHDHSGRSLAEEAHRAGAVVEPTAPVGTCSVALEFTVRGDTARANLLAQRVALELLAVDGVAAVTVAVLEA